MILRDHGKLATRTFLVILSSVVLLAAAVVFIPRYGYAETAGNSDAKANIGSTVNNLVSGNSSVGANTNANASAQSGTGTSASASANAETQTQYKSSYDKKTADSNTKVVVSTDHHLYKPGEQIRIDGGVSADIVAQLQLNQVLVQITDSSGATINMNTLQLGSDGTYQTSFTLPSDAKQGDYNVGSAVQVKADLLGTLSADVKAMLSSHTRFVVVSPIAFAVRAQVNGQQNDYAVQIASNSTLSHVSFDASQKKLTFTVEGQSGTRGVTQVTIPKTMLSGNLQVSIDGAAASGNDVIVTSDTSAEMTLELNYHHSTHDIAITGTAVAPEFPLSMVLVTTGVIGSILVVITRFVRLPQQGSQP